MMRFMRKVRVGGNERGFSLIELMIVVAIIGILATIALPNFQKFQRRARQAEARGTLSAIYTAQKSFAAEWEGYTTDMQAMGYAPEGHIRYDANTGGGGYYPPAYTAANMPQPGVASSVAMCGDAALSPDCVDLTSVGAAAGTATATTFLANAAANLGAPTDDTWSIDQARTMTNLTSGL